jgi:hypothetical protein
VEVIGALPASNRFVNGGGSFLKDGDTVQVRDTTPRSIATSTRNAS